MKNFKKILSGIMCLSLAGTAFSAFPKTEKINAQTAPQETVLGFKNGDINLDGKVDMIDLTALSLRLLDEKVTFDLPDELSSMSSENVQQMINALSDIDSNEKTDLADLATLMQDIKDPSGRSKNKVVYPLPISEDSATETALASSSSSGDILIYCNVNDTDSENKIYAIYNKKTQTVTVIGKGELKYVYPLDGVFNVFCEYANEIKTIDIKEGITSISEIAYNRANHLGMKNLTEVKLPDTLENIGAYSFTKCYSLSKINIPKNVAKIETFAFFNCTSLKEIHIPENTVLQESVFGNYQTISPDMAIYGVKGSYAETYANSNNIYFVEEKEPLEYECPYDITEQCITYTMTTGQAFEVESRKNENGKFTCDRSVLITSMQELEEFNASVCHGTLNKLISELNIKNAFFSKYTLALTVSVEASGSNDLEFSSVEMTSENHVTMKINEYYDTQPHASTTDIKSWVFAAAVPNEFIKDKENTDISNERIWIAENNITEKCTFLEYKVLTNEPKEYNSKLIRSKEEFDKLNEIEGNFVMYDRTDRNSIVHDKTFLDTLSEKLDISEEFFSKNSLAIVKKLEFYSNIKNKLYNASIDDDKKIRLTVQRYIPSEKNDEVSEWYLVAVIPNEAFEGYDIDEYSLISRFKTTEEGK